MLLCYHRLTVKRGIVLSLLLIDGNSILNRAFYGIKVLTTHDGVPTNALVGFLNIYHRLLELTKADAVAVAFDRKAPTFRHRMYDGYKAGRKGMPDELAQQLPLMKELLTLMGITVVEQDGYEADDILGTLSAVAEKNGVPCFIATGDRDSLQLVSDSVTVLLAATRMGRPETVVFDPAAVWEKYGLTPSQLIDLKALMGDTSDNIPGVPGVGEKTALELMHRFGSVNGVYENIDSPDLRDSLRQKLKDGKDSAYLSYQLGTICRDMPLNTDLTAYTLQPMQREPLAARMTRLELFKLMEKLDLTATVAPAPETPVAAAPTACHNCDVLQEPAVDLLLNGDTVTAIAGGRAVTLPATHAAVLTCLATETVSKRVNDTKALAALCLNHGTTLKGVTMDTTLAAYLLDPLSSDYSLTRTAQLYGVAAPESDLPAEIVLFTPVCDRLERELAAHNQQTLLRDMEIPLAIVLADMEREGFAVDGEGIARFGDRLEQNINELVSGITEAVGYEFNLNSPKQLAKALFEDLGLPAGKKTKSGYSTNAEVLEKLKTAHPAVAMLLEYRTLSKLKSTYCDGLLKVIGSDGRIHSSFNQTETRTGRISSAEPNLQNIPVRQELGRELRRFFRAKEGYVLCDAGGLVGGPHHDRRLQYRAGHSPYHRFAGVRRPRRTGHAADALPSQSGKLRHRVRYRRPLVVGRYPRVLRGSQTLH